MVSNLTAVNGYKSGWIGNEKIYIGRKHTKLNLPQSILHNPYAIGKDGDRSEVIEKFRQYLWGAIKSRPNDIWFELVRLALIESSGQKIELVCFCKPESCHGDVIVNAVNWMIKEKKFKDT